MYYRSGELVVIASIILGTIGLWRLWTTGEEQRAITFTAAIVAYPIVLYLVSKIPEAHLRLWVGIPAAVLGPVWLLIGFFIYKSAPPKPPLGTPITADLPSTVATRAILSRRRNGLFLFVLGVLFWLYGATHPNMSRSLELFIVASFLYPSVVGFYWAVTGRKIFD